MIKHKFIQMQSIVARMTGEVADSNPVTFPNLIDQSSNPITPDLNLVHFLDEKRTSFDVLFQSR